MPPAKSQPAADQFQIPAEKVHQAHDAFVKKVLAREVLFVGLLRACAPEVAAAIAAPPFRLVEKKFIDRYLKTTEADLVCEVDLIGGGAAYLIAEHKSTPDLRAWRQVAGYCLSLCDLHQSQGGGHEPPTVIPLIIYHGEEPFALPDYSAEPAVPGAVDFSAFRPILCNLRGVPRDAFGDNPMLQAVVSLLLMDRKREISRQELAGIFADLKADEELLAAGKRYISVRCENVSFDLASAAELDAKIERGTNMGTIAQEYYHNGVLRGLAEGEANGIAKGKAEGRAEGEAAVLLRLLEHRFPGKVTRSARKRVERASVEELDAWTVRVLDAQSIEAVFRVS